MPPQVDDAPSSESTTPTVDVLGGYITSLAASVMAYEEKITSLVFRFTTLLSQTSKAAGDGSTQELDAYESDFKGNFQALLRDFDNIVSFQTGNLTIVLKMFDEALARQLAINAGLSATMEAIQESLAAQQAFLGRLASTQEFIESVVGPGWDGTGENHPAACTTWCELFRV